MTTQIIEYLPLKIDIINDLDGVAFEEIWLNKSVVTMLGVPVNFIGYHELLKVKFKAGRSQDLADINKF